MKVCDCACVRVGVHEFGTQCYLCPYLRMSQAPFVHYCVSLPPSPGPFMAAARLSRHGNVPSDVNLRFLPTFPRNPPCASHWPRAPGEFPSRCGSDVCSTHFKQNNLPCVTPVQKHFCPPNTPSLRMSQSLLLLRLLLLLLVLSRLSALSK